jgi:hypothetical protein
LFSAANVTSVHEKQLRQAEIPLAFNIPNLLRRRDYPRNAENRGAVTGYWRNQPYLIGIDW